MPMKAVKARRERRQSRQFTSDDEHFLRGLGITLENTLVNYADAQFQRAALSERALESLEAHEGDARLKQLYLLVADAETRRYRIARNDLLSILGRLRVDARDDEDERIVSFLHQAIPEQDRAYQRYPWRLVSVEEVGGILWRYNPLIYSYAVEAVRRRLGLMDDDHYPFPHPQDRD